MEKSKPRKTDRRTLYTRSVIKDSFLELSKKLPYDKINVTALCRQAEISRATFYLHYGSVDAVLDEVIDDALQFTGNETAFLDEIDVIQKGDMERLRSGRAVLPACQRIADSDRYHSLFMDPLVSDHIIQRIAAHQRDHIIPKLMKQGNLTEDEADAVMRFILYGSFAVNRSLGWNKDDRWYRIQDLIARFIYSGMQLR